MSSLANLQEQISDNVDVASSQVPRTALGSSASIISSSSVIPARHRRLSRPDSINSDDGDAQVGEGEEIPNPSISSIPEDHAITPLANATVNRTSASNQRRSSPRTPSAQSRSPTSQDGPTSLIEHDNRATGSPVYSRFSLLNTADNRTSRFGRQEADRSLSQDRRPSRSRFGLRALSNIIREIGQDVREVVEEVRRPSARSASRGRHLLGLSPDSREELNEIGSSVSSGRTVSRSEDRRSASGGPGRRTVDYDEYLSRGRDMTINPIGGAAERRPESQLGEGQQDGYKEFKKGTLFRDMASLPIHCSS